MGKNYISSVRVVMATDSEPVNSFSSNSHLVKVHKTCWKQSEQAWSLGRGRNSTP